jgi:hypothetical protein
MTTTILIGAGVIIILVVAGAFVIGKRDRDEF